jgi:hypothetical protein
MMDTTRRFLLARSVLGTAGLLSLVSAAAAATSARQINSDADRALSQLYAAQPRARNLAGRAVGVLIFPKIYKGGLIIGGLSGDGVLRVGGKTAGYYNISAASFGLQAGGQWHRAGLRRIATQCSRIQSCLRSARTSGPILLSLGIHPSWGDRRSPASSRPVKLLDQDAPNLAHGERVGLG